MSTHYLIQYLDEFTHYIKILKYYCAMREGEHLLTPEIEIELANFNQVELT